MTFLFPRRRNMKALQYRHRQVTQGDWKNWRDAFKTLNKRIKTSNTS